MISTAFSLAREDISLLCRGWASVFIVSPPGIHISLGICVWGYTYHGDTHITVTPVIWASFLIFYGWYPVPSVWIGWGDRTCSPDSRNSCGWYPLKMDQITRASPAELRTIVRAIWRSIGYTTICASNRYIFDQIKKNPPFWYSGRWIDETRTYINDYLI